MNRQNSKFKVIVFDPNRDPSVAANAAAEKAKDKTVIGVSAIGRWGMIETPNGTYCIDNDGVGESVPMALRGPSIPFCRKFEGRLECAPFAEARYSLAECQACATGEILSLDQFIGSGTRKNNNFDQWEKFLEGLNQ